MVGANPSPDPLVFKKSMNDTDYPKRASLEKCASDIFKVVSRGAPPDQWAEWLRVSLEYAVAEVKFGMFSALIGAVANWGAGFPCERLFAETVTSENIHAFSFTNAIQ